MSSEFAAIWFALSAFFLLIGLLASLDVLRTWHAERRMRAGERATRARLWHEIGEILSAIEARNREAEWR